MPDPFDVRTQYNDLVGEVALDGHSGPPLDQLGKLANVPSGYRAVGFQLFRLDPDVDGSVPFTVVAVRRDEVGDSMQDIGRFAQTHDTLPLYSFDGRLELAHFPALFKRFDMKVLRKELAGPKPVVSRPTF